MVSGLPWLKVTQVFWGECDESPGAQPLELVRLRSSLGDTEPPEKGGRPSGPAQEVPRSLCEAPEAHEPPRAN